MSHILPPDDEGENFPKRKELDNQLGSSPTIKFFTLLVILMGLFILGTLIKDSFKSKQASSSNMEESSFSNGGSLGGALGGSVGGTAVPYQGDNTTGGESGMKVFVNSPNGGELRELTLEQQEAMYKYLDEAVKQQETSKPIGGDTTEAVPVGGAGGGQ